MRDVEMLLCWVVVLGGGAVWRFWHWRRRADRAAALPALPLVDAVVLGTLALMFPAAVALGQSAVFEAVVVVAVLVAPMVVIAARLLEARRARQQDEQHLALGIPIVRRLLAPGWLAAAVFMGGLLLMLLTVLGMVVAAHHGITRPEAMVTLAVAGAKVMAVWVVVIAAAAALVQRVRIWLAHRDYARALTRHHPGPATTTPDVTGAPAGTGPHHRPQE